jgi:hypothetical protein
VRGLLGHLIRIGSAEPASAHPAADVGTAELCAAKAGPRRAKTGRTAVYAVRVRTTFKSEMLQLQAELQLERQQQARSPGRVTEGEVIETMLEAFQAARRNGGTAAASVALADEVWQGIDAIARHEHCSAAQTIERLVVQRIAELGLLPRRS